MIDCYYCYKTTKHDVTHPELKAALKEKLAPPPTIPDKIRYTHTYEGDGYNTSEYIWGLAEEQGLDQEALEAKLGPDWRYYGPPIIEAEVELDTNTGEINMINILTVDGKPE